MFRVPTPAKLNLFLHITGQRPDGYHNLQTIFQIIDLQDYITFEPRQDAQLILQGMNSVETEQNLIFKAANLIKPYANQFCGLNISIEKNIPMGAGLGGGSSNAATCLMVCNKIWQCGLSQTELAALGLKLGADVPVFVLGQNAWAEGVGEILQAVQLPKQRYIVLKPDCFISTQLLFSQKLLTRDSKQSTFCAYQTNPSSFGNNFTALARQLYPAVDEAMQYLNQFGIAKLTGTGACVFVECGNSTDVEVETVLANAPCTAYNVLSLAESPTLAAVAAI